MYGRTPRVLTHAAGGSTGSKLGPGYYSPQEPGKHHRADGFAPFSSLATRETFLDISDAVAMAPGPGFYDQKASHDVTKGAGHMDSKTRRFGDPNFITPGPGAYNVIQPLDHLGQPLNVEQPLLSVTPFPQIKYTRQPTAPSIPIPGKSYGYEETETGGLLPQAPPDRDKTMGPAYYNVNHNDTEATKRYRGVHFGQLKEKRPELTGLQGPGPADYTTGNQQDSSSAKKPPPPASSFNSKVPRYHEAVSQKAAKNNIPGPGEYEFPSQFKNDIDSIGHAPFGSTATRFYGADKPVPAPGSYDDPRTALETTKRLVGMKKSPFGQTSVRFKLNKHALQIPGPGMYNDMAATSLSVQLSKKAIVESNKRGGFGSVATRKLPLVNKDTAEMPGPAHYNPTDDCKSIVSWVPESCTANFASSSKRIHEPPPIVTDIPPPGTYEVHKSHAKTQGRISHNQTPRDHPFWSSSSRFAPPRDILLNQPDPTIPGPDKYQVETKVNNAGLICSRDPRFKNDKNDSPGPAAYSLSVPQRDTLLKGTFNVTLDNPYSKDSLRSQKMRGIVSNQEQPTIIVNN